MKLIYSLTCMRLSIGHKPVYLKMLGAGPELDETRPYFALLSVHTQRLNRCAPELSKFDGGV
jgi:hypothetical protein